MQLLSESFVVRPSDSEASLSTSERLALWTNRVRATIADIPCYPGAAFSGRGTPVLPFVSCYHDLFLFGVLNRDRVFAGVVMAAGAKGQIISALMNVQVIRQHLRSRLPVEIFYAAEAEMPSYMRLRFQACANVSVINIFDAPTIPALGGSLPRDIDLRGLPNQGCGDAALVVCTDSVVGRGQFPARGSCRPCSPPLRFCSMV